VTCTFSLILSLRYRITHLCKYWLNIALQEKLCLKLMCNIEINQNCYYCHNHIIIYHHYWLYCHWKTTIECSDDVTAMLFDGSCVIHGCVLWLGMTFCWVLTEYNIYKHNTFCGWLCTYYFHYSHHLSTLWLKIVSHLFKEGFFLYSCYILFFLMYILF
jgi:hypothetical protein